MKRKALALTLIVTILVLSCSMVIGMHKACFVQANFVNEQQKISVILLSPENESYAPDNLRLTFRVSHWYNANIDTWLILDNQAPVLLYLSSYRGFVGASEYDSSLTGLKDGSHVIKIRASSGEDYSEGRVFFTIDSISPTTPTPSPNPTPTPSPSPEPAIAPKLEQSDSVSATLVAGVSGALVMMISMCLLFYFKKRKVGTRDET